MATLGLLSPEFPSVSLSANLDAIAATGAVSVQFDLASAVGHTFPSELSQDTVEAIKAGFSERQLTLAALSGTYNMIDPDPQAREAGAEGLNRVIALDSQARHKCCHAVHRVARPQQHVAKASRQRHT